MINFQITVSGTAPLLMHNGRLANPLDPAAKALKRLTGKRQKTEADYNDLARVEFSGSIYSDPDIGPYLPGDNIWRALYDAAKKTKKGKAVQESVFITSDINPLAYTGPRDIDALWKDENFRHITTVKVGTNRTTRCRPIFREWRCQAEGILDDNILEFGDLAGIATLAGAVIGLGAYAASLPRFRRAILPRSSTIVLTAPTPERLEDVGWTGGEGVYDYRSTLHYLRTTPDGRIAFGGAGARTGLGTGLGPRMDFDEAAVTRLVRDLHRWFPSFHDVPVECAWGGPIDVTGLHLPFFGTLPSGNLHYALGFTGGGVGPCHLAGRILSGLALGAEDDFTRLPIVGAEPKPFPPEPLRSPGALLVTRAIMRKDDADDDDRRPNPLVDLLARLPRRLGYNLGP